MTRSAHSLTALPGWNVLGQFARALINLVKAYKDRREVMQLAEFDDRMLKDIGLIRSDVDDALAEPIFHNPSWILVRCAERHVRVERLSQPTRSIRPVVPVVRRSDAYA